MSKCSECKHSQKVEDAECANIYECDAEKYDIDNHACFEPKEA